MIRAYESCDTSLDLRELIVRVEYDRELLEDVFQVFKEEFPKLLTSLRDAITCEDFKQLQANAHTLKGMLASMSFSNAAASAFRIERMAKQFDLAGIPAEVTRLESDAASARAGLEQLCAGLAQ